MKIKNLNPHLKKLGVDHLYHLGLDTSMNLKKMFGDVKYVCMGGSPDRAYVMAKKLAKDLKIKIKGSDLKPVGKSERYSVYKVGPIISASHGIGMPSLAVFMHEITKLLYYSECEDPMLMRIGTSGGVGLEGGTVVVTEEALNAELKPVYEIVVLGKKRAYPAQLSKKINQEIINANREFEVVQGKTVAANCFYEEQSRLDGVLDPGFTEADKMAFLNKAYMMGVRNFEMESSQFAAFCNRAGIKAAVVCVTLLNRLNGDQITASPKTLSGYSDNSQTVAVNYIRSRL
ncbi:MAG: uridine phosphorylase [Deltaproteobacteria bacterium]|nr:uridine phosphorylase [Deltaproteobacteria bacterium]